MGHVDNDLEIGKSGKDQSEKNGLDIAPDAPGMTLLLFYLPTWRECDLIKIFTIRYRPIRRPDVEKGIELVLWIGWHK